MKKITWSCNLDASGYSSCARSYIKALFLNNNCEVNVIANNVAKNINLTGLDFDDLNFFSKLYVGKKESFRNLVQHTVPDRFIFGENNIIYTITELICPKRWTKICNKIDLIMTASSFSKQKMIESGFEENRIEIIPHCHDLSMWNPEIKPLNIKNLKDFNFVFVGDYTPRKNGDFLIESFLKAFEGNKNVSLTIKGYFNSFSKEDQIKLFKRIKSIINNSYIQEDKRPSVFFYGEPISEKIMSRFMNSFDCLVSPHRGEGWGLALSQMMALGKPVIGTNYSGNLHFMNSNNSFLIDIKGFENVCKEMVLINPNYEGCKWPIIDQDSLIDQMRFVYNNKQKSEEITLNGQKYIHDNFSFEKISNLILDKI